MEASGLLKLLPRVINGEHIVVVYHREREALHEMRELYNRLGDVSKTFTFRKSQRTVEHLASHGRLILYVANDRGVRLQGLRIDGFVFTMRQMCLTHDVELYEDLLLARSWGNRIDEPT